MAVFSSLDHAAAVLFDPKNGRNMLQLSRDFGVSLSSLKHRIYGRRSRSVAARSAQNLLPEEEEVLFDAVEQLYDSNWALTKSHIVGLAEELVAARKNDSRVEFGVYWVNRFFKRWPSLDKRWSKPLNTVHANV